MSFPITQSWLPVLLRGANSGGMRVPNTRTQSRFVPGLFAITPTVFQGTETSITIGSVTFPLEKVDFAQINSIEPHSRSGLLGSIGAVDSVNSVYRGRNPIVDISPQTPVSNTIQVNMPSDGMSSLIGRPVVFSNGVAGDLVNGTTYYLVPTDTSRFAGMSTSNPNATRPPLRGFSLATTYANAVRGVVITLTTAWTGNVLMQFVESMIGYTDTVSAQTPSSSTVAFDTIKEPLAVGTAVVVEGGTPGDLSNGVTYYLVPQGDTAIGVLNNGVTSRTSRRFAFATTYANAIAGTVVTMTAGWTGTSYIRKVHGHQLTDTTQEMLGRQTQFMGVVVSDWYETNALYKHVPSYIDLTAIMPAAYWNMPQIGVATNHRTDGLMITALLSGYTTSISAPSAIAAPTLTTPQAFSIQVNGPFANVAPRTPFFDLNLFQLFGVAFPTQEPAYIEVTSVPASGFGARVLPANRQDQPMTNVRIVRLSTPNVVSGVQVFTFTIYDRHGNATTATLNLTVT
jgi:hypothetical protein